LAALDFFGTDGFRDLVEVFLGVSMTYCAIGSTMIAKNVRRTGYPSSPSQTTGSKRAIVSYF
jgi:hypothetical protein